jgi:hypothetical protein
MNASVLVVDGDRKVAGILTDACMLEGYQTRAESDPFDALLMLRLARSPHVVIWSNTTLDGDLALPFFQAFTSAVNLCQRHRALYLTTEALEYVPRRLRELFERHAIPILTKPFDLDVFYTVLASLSATCPNEAPIPAQ